MHVYEVGIIIGGVPVITANYINPNEKEVDLIHKCALLSCILNFADILISPVEYFESNNYCFIFKKDSIVGSDSEENEIYAYFVSNKYKNFSKHVKNKYYPVLMEILDEFKSSYNGWNFAYSSQFIGFKRKIDSILKTSTKTLEQKVGLLFYNHSD